MESAFHIYRIKSQIRDKKGFISDLSHTKMLKEVMDSSEIAYSRGQRWHKADGNGNDASNDGIAAIPPGDPHHIVGN